MVNEFISRGTQQDVLFHTSALKISSKFINSFHLTKKAHPEIYCMIFSHSLYSKGRHVNITLLKVLKQYEIVSVFSLDCPSLLS